MTSIGQQGLKARANHCLNKIDKSLEDLAFLRAKLLEVVEWADKVGGREEDYVQKRIAEAVAPLEKELEKYRGAPRVQSDQVALVRAKTFAIVDSILFAIENWATDDSPAPDITLASQATLFPVMFEKVSQGDENYYLYEVPDSAIEVVKRGREFVQKFREEEHISVLDPTGWEVLQPLLHSWWTRDAMPLLYGAGYEGWELETPYTRDQMLTWRDKEMSRALEFPLIFDGFELVKKYGDEIREETGLPDFSRQVMQTRITAHG